jgi:hypothetical protein
VAARAPAPTPRPTAARLSAASIVRCWHRRRASGDSRRGFGLAARVGRVQTQWTATAALEVSSLLPTVSR